MKVCTKCGWQNEDEEAKCFQCYADLTSEATEVAEEPETSQTDEANEQTADESADVWNDPDMRPVHHDTPEQETEQAPPLRVLEEEAVYEEPAAEKSRLPLWAVVVIAVVFVLVVAIIGRAVAKVSDGSPKQAALRFLDALSSGNMNAIKATVSSGSQEIAEVAPMLMGQDVGRAISAGRSAVYSIQEVEEKGNDIALVWCDITVQDPSSGYRNTVQGSVAVYTKVEQGKWVADLRMMALAQKFERFKHRRRLPPPPSE